MSIRATPALRRSTLSLPLAAALALAGCGPSAATADAAAQDSPDIPGQPADCLDPVWKSQAAPDKAFDRAHDQADGGSISCATGTGASQFATALAAIRRAAQRGNTAALAANVDLPLLYIDRRGTKRELDRAQLKAAADEVFAPPVLALLAKLQLADLAVIPHQGAFADLGAVWLVAGRPGAQPRIVTIDRQALDEAAARNRPK